MTANYVVIGAGGHARVLIAALRAAGIFPVGCLDNDATRWSEVLLGVTVVGNDEALASLGRPDQLLLVNGVGSTGDPRARRRVWERFTGLGYRFASVVDPRAMVSEDVTIDTGAQVLAAAVVQPGTRIGEDAIINTGASVDHDCLIGPHVHIAPGAVLCGSVRIGEGSHVGAGAVVRQGIQIGSCAVIATGAAVIKDVADHSVVGGVPARVLHATGGQE